MRVAGSLRGATVMVIRLRLRAFAVSFSPFNSPGRRAASASFTGLSTSSRSASGTSRAGELQQPAAPVHQPDPHQTRRSGPARRSRPPLDLHDGKVFVVTIDHPDNPARLLNAEASCFAAAPPAGGAWTRSGRTGFSGWWLLKA